MVERLGPADDAGIVDEDIERADARLERLDKRRGAFLGQRREIGLEGFRAAAELANLGR